jgi:hypothetical protein
MLIVVAASALFAFVLLIPEPALAWGPVTHVALGMQVLASVITPDYPLQAVLASLPEVFLYGSLAPDIVQGRRLQSRLRRHSHNWAVGLELLRAAKDPQESAFAMGYLAHLAADVIAHNFYLPARFIGYFESGVASHIYAEARFDSIQPARYHEMLVTLMDADFGELDAMLDRAIDSPLVPFRAHRRVFEGGLKRIRQWNAVIKALSPMKGDELADTSLFTGCSCSAIGGVIRSPEHAPARSYDPMGTEPIKHALASRKNLQRLMRMGPEARKTARNLADTMVRDVQTHLRQAPFVLKS